MKKTISRLILAAAIVFVATSALGMSACTLPFCFHTDSDNNTVCDKCGSSHGIYYKVNPDGISCSVTRVKDTATTAHIPEYLDGYKVTGISSVAFILRDSVTEITIPSGVTSIEESTFLYCKNLTAITIDQGNSTYRDIDGSLYTKDGKALLKYPIGKSDTSFTLPEGVATIGKYAFGNCSALTSINIPDSVTSIGDDAFSNCYALTSINIPAGVTSIGSWAFSSCKSITGIDIPDSVASIGKRAFRGCTSLESITVHPENQSYASKDGSLYTKDGKTLIQYAIGKTDASFAIPDGITRIDDNAFYDCEILDSIVIPDSVTSIGDDAFRYCSALTSINISDGVTSIGDYAFSSCSALTSINIPASVTSIGGNAFVGCTALEEINVDPDNRSYTDIDGNLCTKDGKALLHYAGGKTDESITIPDGITVIGEWAFALSPHLVSVIIPDGVTEIGDQAFSFCENLTSVVIPDTVTHIGKSAFLKSDKLTSIVIPRGLTTIGESAFANCSALTEVVIPDSVTAIGDFAFSDCANLTSIVIPVSVTSMGDAVFFCSQNLKSIKYCGTRAQWRAISKSDVWDYDTGDFIITYKYAGK